MSNTLLAAKFTRLEENVILFVSHLGKSVTYYPGCSFHSNSLKIILLKITGYSKLYGLRKIYIVSVSIQFWGTIPNKTSL